MATYSNCFEFERKKHSIAFFQVFERLAEWHPFTAMPIVLLVLFRERPYLLSSSIFVCIVCVSFLPDRDRP